jgi:hypothetical protein
MDEAQTTVLPIVSSTGKRLFQVEVLILGGREQVSVLPRISEEDLSAAVEAVGRTIGAALSKITPARATAEFSIEKYSNRDNLLLCFVKVRRSEPKSYFRMGRR